MTPGFQGMPADARPPAPPGGAPSRRPLTVALAGNPNAGKTTLFNSLTGARQHVGNYPGVTVEKREGRFRHLGREVTVVDLPGTYSLTACTLDERVARDFVLRERPDVVVDVADASNLERSLYLTVQFMELGVPLVVVLNMSDVAEARGFRVQTELFARLLGATVVRTVGHRGIGLDALKDAVVGAAEAAAPRLPAAVHYGPEIEEELARLEPLARGKEPAVGAVTSRWVALKLLEGDAEVRARVGDGALAAAADEAAARIQRHFADRPEIVIADRRYGFISGACQEAVQQTVELRHTRSDRIDDVLTSRAFGLPIFLLLMYLVFKFTFTLGAPASEWVAALCAWLSRAVAAAWPPEAAPAWRSLVTDGVIAGVGGVVTFLPNVVLLFAAIAVLEDSGYMARAAFIMDRWMHRIGLHGQSFIPMVLGFGCTVPAILATRILENRRDRLTTMLVLPLFSCGARFPIYTLFVPAFFPPGARTPVIMALYLTGVLLAVGAARLLRRTLLKGDPSMFVMELPPYRRPTLRGVLQHTWERGWLFLRKAGTVIVGISILLWVLTSYPRLPAERARELEPAEAARAAIEHSLAGRIGHALAPVMRPVGFDWKVTTALIGALAAKEVFVAQLGILNALGEGRGVQSSLAAALQRDYTRLQAFCIMLFCLISLPCVMTLVTTARESGSWRWALLQTAGLTVLAYAATLAVYQAGLLVQRLGTGA